MGQVVVNKSESPHSGSHQVEVRRRDNNDVTDHHDNVTHDDHYPPSDDHDAASHDHDDVRRRNRLLVIQASAGHDHRDRSRSTHLRCGRPTSLRDVSRT